MRRLLLSLFLLSFILPLAGCDSSDDPAPSEGVDLEALFAPPTRAERDAVRQEWAERTTGGAYTPGALEVAYDEVQADGSRLVILSHTTGGADFRHYGAVRFPAPEAPEGGWPVLVLNHGGDAGLSLEDELGRLPAFGRLPEEAVIVAPTFRAETMRDTPLGNLASEGSPSPWDRDVDDALALLNAVLEAFPDETDEGRLGTLGFSRGAAVSLLMAQRDERLAVVSAYFGPTDFFARSIQGLAYLLLHGTPDEQAAVRQLPGARYLEESVLLPLGEGAVTYEQARRELIRRSSAHFADLLPHTQAHHHRCDAVVPFDQFEALHEREGEIWGETDFHAYDAECPSGEPKARFHSFDPALMPGNLEATQAFLEAHLLVGQPTVWAF